MEVVDYKAMRRAWVNCLDVRCVDFFWGPYRFSWLMVSKTSWVRYGQLAIIGVMCRRKNLLQQVVMAVLWFTMALDIGRKECAPLV